MAENQNNVNKAEIAITNEKNRIALAAESLRKLRHKRDNYIIDSQKKINEMTNQIRKLEESIESGTNYIINMTETNL